MPFAEMLAALPPAFPDETLLAQIRAEVVRSGRKVVVLDDDPTGPQAIRDVFVLTEWSVATLCAELQAPRPLFFVLTNTRALPVGQAVALHREIAANLQAAAQQCGASYTLIVRGDSTLRGHYPDDVEALGGCDGVILAPFFEEGGRFTYDDVQWVKEDAQLIPAAQMPYARDQVFGYRHSNLRNWVAEKTHGRVRAAEVIAIALDVLRRGAVAQVVEMLLRAQGQTIIVNAVSYRDLEVFMLALLRAEAQGKRFVARTAASFVRVRAGQEGLKIKDWKLEVEKSSPNFQSSTPLLKAQGQVFNLRSSTSNGGLIIVGSHVPKSSAQLRQLLGGMTLASCELRVQEVVAGRAAAEGARVAQAVERELAAGRHIVVYTSREVEPRAREEALAVGQQVSALLVDVVRNLQLKPRFIIAKGGWTASEIGTQALGVKRAYAPAPIWPGVPMWVLGEETRFAGMPYVIFPGNVGDEGALMAVVEKLAASGER